MDLKPVRRVRLSAQIEEQLKQQLLEGRWKAGERLPSEHELSRIFQVSRVSIPAGALRPGTDRNPQRRRLFRQAAGHSRSDAGFHPRYLSD